MYNCYFKNLVTYQFFSIRTKWLSDKKSKRKSQELYTNIVTGFDSACLVLFFENVDDFKENFFGLLIKFCNMTKEFTLFAWSSIALGNELKRLDVSDKEVFLGPTVHIICHLIRAEMRYEQFLVSDCKLTAAQSLELFHYDDQILFC